MTNQEKYKTAREREQAFVRFCEPRICKECPVHAGHGAGNGCVLIWLEMEAEEELLPCPFCGGKASAIDSKFSLATFVRCDNCHSTTGNFKTKEMAIAAWNRRAK